MRLISRRTDTGETLGVVVGDRWLPASEVLDGGPRTMADLIAGGKAMLTALRDGVDGARIPGAAISSPMRTCSLPCRGPGRSWRSVGTIAITRPK